MTRTQPYRLAPLFAEQAELPEMLPVELQAMAGYHTEAQSQS